VRRLACTRQPRSQSEISSAYRARIIILAQLVRISAGHRRVYTKLFEGCGHEDGVTFLGWQLTPCVDFLGSRTGRVAIGQVHGSGKWRWENRRPTSFIHRMKLCRGDEQLSCRGTGTETQTETNRTLRHKSETQKQSANNPS
jgi:hypothetical protein